jgi:WD40 repeat protein
LISTGDDGRVMSWEFGTAPDSSVTKLYVSPSEDVALIPGTYWLATQEKPESLVIRNWRSGTTVAKTDGIAELLVEASPDGQWLAIFNRRELRMIRITQRDGPLPVLHTVAGWQPTGELTSVRFSPDSQKVGVIEHARVGAPNAGEYSLSMLALPGLDQIQHHPVHEVSRVAFAPTGGRLALRTGIHLAIWDNSKGKLLWEAAQTDADYLRFSPDGMLVISRDNLRNVVVRDARDGAVRFRLTGQRAQIESIAISPDGRTLATSAENGVIKLSHLPTGRDLFDLHVAEVACAHLEFAEDGRHLLCRTRTHLRQPYDEILVFVADGPDEPQ